MEAKVVVVSIVVTNKERSIAFYIEKAGFEKKTDLVGPGGYRWVTVGFPGQDLELSLWDVGGGADPSQSEAAKRWAPATTPPIVLRVTDCRKAHAELSAKGVEFVQGPMDHPWGTSATFKDPDGNLFSMTQPPGGPARRQP